MKIIKAAVIRSTNTIIDMDTLESWTPPTSGRYQVLVTKFSIVTSQGNCGVVFIVESAKRDRKCDFKKTVVKLTAAIAKETAETICTSQIHKK